jgi:hypothetical protein
LGVPDYHFIPAPTTEARASRPARVMPVRVYENLRIEISFSLRQLVRANRLSPHAGMALARDAFVTHRDQ